MISNPNPILGTILWGGHFLECVEIIYLVCIFRGKMRTKNLIVLSSFQPSGGHFSKSDKSINFWDENTPRVDFLA